MRGTYKVIINSTDKTRITLNKITQFTTIKVIIREVIRKIKEKIGIK
jgi:hypothetical protein